MAKQPNIGRKAMKSAKEKTKYAKPALAAIGDIEEGYGACSNGSGNTTGTFGICNVGSKPAGGCLNGTQAAGIAGCKSGTSPLPGKACNAGSGVVTG